MPKEPGRATVARPSQFQFDPDYQFPALTSKRGVLRALRDVAEAAARGVLDNKTTTAITYALQVAMSVHRETPRNDDKPAPSTPRRK